MSVDSHRDRADAARTAAAASELPNVRARNLRSAEASNALAARAEAAAATLKVRQAESARRKAVGDGSYDEEEDDGGAFDD